MHRFALTPLSLCLVQGMVGFASLPQEGPITAISLRQGATQVELHGRTGYRIQREGVLTDLLPQRPVLHLRKWTMDPLAPEAQAQAPASNLRRQLQRQSHRGQAYLVQFQTQVLPEYQEELGRLGVSCHVPVPDQALVVRMDAQARRRVEALPYVRWVGPYLPTHKLEEGLDEVVESGDAHPRPYHVMLLEPKLAPGLAARFRALGIPFQGEGNSLRLQAELDARQLELVSRMDEVLFIDRVTDYSDDNDLIRTSSGVPALATVAGYQGEGVRGEVCETQGFRASHSAFQAQPPVVLANHTSNDHGTKVMGSLFGNGNASGANKGTLPKASGYFMSIYSLNNGSYPTNAQRRAHVAQMVDPLKPYRIVFQTYSNGNAVTTKYTTDSAENDAIAFDHDLLMFNSQGNEGSTNSRPQAWAKNIISVGGMASQGTVDLADDAKSGASTGYAADGRIKPDLAHYYSVTTTTNVSDTSFGGTSGTSFSTPATAGLGGLFFQMWADGVFEGGPGKGRDVFGSRPHAATAKAILVNTAKQWSFSGTTSTRDRKYQGWGMADVKGMYDTAQAHGWTLPILINESAPIAPQATHTYTLGCDGTRPLKATLVFRDPAGNPAATKARINNLDLKVTSPSGVVYWGNNGLKAGNWSTSGGTANDVDTTENVFIQTPEAGTWTLQVLGTEVLQDGHPSTPALDAVYALVAQGGSTAPQPLALVTQPQDRTVTAGGSVSFTVGATGGRTPYAYQWEKNGVALSGATASTYTFTAQAGDHGALYRATVTDTGGTTLTSRAASLTVNVPPSITTQPASTTVSLGQVASFSVVASGTAPLGYQWAKGSTPIPGATSSTYTTPATSSADHGTTFTVTVTNGAGSVTSIPATLSVAVPRTWTVGTTTALTSTGSNAALRAVRFTMPEDGVLQSLSLAHLAGANGTGKMLLGVYTGTTTAPTTRLGLTAPTVVTTGDGWQTLPLLQPVTLRKNEVLWIAWVFEQGATVKVKAAANSTFLRVQAAATQTYSAGMPASFGPVAATSAWNYSVYATYQPGTGGAAFMIPDAR